MAVIQFQRGKSPRRPMATTHRPNGSLWPNQSARLSLPEVEYESMRKGDIVPDLFESRLLADEVEPFVAQFDHDMGIGSIG
jgi:hypothetical protein